VKTAYLFWSRCDNASYRAYGDQELVYISSAIDLRFIDNVVFHSGGTKVKLQVWQPNEHDVIPDVPTIWYSVLDDRPMSNRHLEEAFSLVRGIGYQLLPYTRLGQSFSLRQAYSIPNVPQEFVLEETEIVFGGSGSFGEFIWSDRSTTIIGPDGEPVHPAQGKTVKADLLFVVGSDTQQSQVQRVHITQPATNMEFDASGVRSDGDVQRLEEVRSPGDDPVADLVLELHNEALCAPSTIAASVLMYQIVEVLIGCASARRLEPESIDAVAAARDSGLAPELVQRVASSVQNISYQTSRELLIEGLAAVVPNADLEHFNLDDFTRWRRARGQLTHPRTASVRSELELSALHTSIRRVVDTLVNTLRPRHRPSSGTLFGAQILGAAS